MVSLHPSRQWSATSNQAAIDALLLLLLMNHAAAKKDYNRPHPHQDVLKSHSTCPFQSLKLSFKDEKDLAAGKSVMKQSKPGPGELSGNVICVQDIDAPKEAVWSQILDLDSYKGKVPKVTESKNYVVKKNPDGSTQIKTKMVVGVIPGYSVRC